MEEKERVKPGLDGFHLVPTRNVHLGSEMQCIVGLVLKAGKTRPELPGNCGASFSF